MNTNQVYAVLNKRITSSLTGIGGVELVGNNILRFTNQKDGSTFDVKLPFDFTAIEIVDTLPNPTDKLVNKVYFLLSDDHFYKCIKDDKASTYKFKDVTPSSGEGIAIYNDYSSLPTKSDKDTIAYVKDDYTDTTNNTTHKKGFYLYDITNSKWELVSGQGGSASSDYTETITTSSKTWNIQHNLNTEWWKLQINIIDSEGNITYGDVDLDKTTNNLLVLVFETETQGKIYIKK